MQAILIIFYRYNRLWSWVRYRSVRRLTPAGWLVLVSLTVAAVMSIDPESTVAYQAFTPLLFLMIAAVTFAFAFRARFTVGRRLPRFGTVGRKVSYTIVLKNNGRSEQRDLWLLEDLADSRPTFAEWKAMQLNDERRLSFRIGRRRRQNPFRVAVFQGTPVPPVSPGEEAEIAFELLPLRRGSLRFHGVILARPDPFGLFRALSRQRAFQSMLVLPRRYALPDVVLPGSARYQEGGVALASSVGQSDEFVSLREYRRGDPLRHIHWRSWAKAGKPIVKEFEDEFFVRHALVLDTFSDDPRSEAFEEAVSVAASFACTIPLQESLLDLLFVGTEAYCFTAGRGLAHSDQMLEILASVTPCLNRPFGTLEPLVMNHASVVSGCICVLLGWDDDRRGFVRKLEQLEIPLLVLVVVESGKGRSVDPEGLPGFGGRFVVLEAGRIEEGLAKLR